VLQCLNKSHYRSPLGAIDGGHGLISRQPVGVAYASAGQASFNFFSSRNRGQLKKGKFTYAKDSLWSWVLGINGTENRVKVTRVVQIPSRDRGTGKFPIQPY